MWRNEGWGEKAQRVTREMKGGETQVLQGDRRTDAWLVPFEGRWKERQRKASSGQEPAQSCPGL